MYFPLHCNYNENRATETLSNDVILVSHIATVEIYILVITGEAPQNCHSQQTNIAQLN